MLDNFPLLDHAAASLNARVDIDGGAIILHSRSGKARNRDYRPALETIISRMDSSNAQYAIYLDSNPVKDQPLELRRLAFNFSSPIPQRFNEIVRSMNAGTSSNGAWRRLRIEVQGANEAEIVALLSVPSGSTLAPPARLPVSTLRKVASEHIDHAVSLLRSGEDPVGFESSTKFDLLAPDGNRFAPKKVFALALEGALGIKAHPNHFSAGFKNPAYQLLEAAGYPIVSKSYQVTDAVSSVDPDMALAEGSPKLRKHLQKERKPALANAKKRAMRDALGHLACERCHLISSSLGPLGDAVIEVHHSAVTVANMADGHVTRLTDLQCLCANCHRIIHREIATSNFQKS